MRKPYRQYGQRVLVVALVIACTVAPVLAQFGGFVDPVQSGHAVVQIGHEVKQLAQGEQMIQNGVKIATTALNTYSLFQYERMMLQNRIGWLQLTGQLLNDYSANKWGETTPWGKAMNGSMKDIQAAYGVATVALANPMWARGYTLKNPQVAVASIETYDAAIQVAMAQISQQRANQMQNSAAQRLLASQITSTSAALNTSKAQQNLTNGALMQQISAANQQTQAITAQNGMMVVQQIRLRNEDTAYFNEVTTFQTAPPLPAENLQATFASLRY